MDEDETPAWLPLGEASQRLDTTVDALRKQIRRGRLQSRKGNDGRLLVLVTGGQTPASHVQDSGRTVTSHGEDEGRTVASLLDRLDRTRLDLEQARLALVRAEADRDHARELAAAERAYLERAAEDLRRQLQHEQARADRLEERLALPWWKRLLG
jgi:DNA repair exonuclease SbcCD ATPase subunit